MHDGRGETCILRVSQTVKLQPRNFLSNPSSHYLWPCEWAQNRAWLENVLGLGAPGRRQQERAFRAREGGAWDTGLRCVRLGLAWQGPPDESGQAPRRIHPPLLLLTAS